VPVPEELSRDELIALVGEQAGQITRQAEQLAELAEANEALAAQLARLEHLLSRNSGNSSSPPSRDDDLGKTGPPEKKRRGDGKKRGKGKQRGAPGSHLEWTEHPDQRQDRFPDGTCDCGSDLALARDVGVVDRYQQHEIPQVSVRVTQYEQHEVRCGCGRLHTAARPEGARPGPVGYGPNLQAFAVYLMVVHFLPAHRVVALLESLTGTAPSVGFCHGMLARTAGLLSTVHDRIRTLITFAHVVACDETPLKVGPKKPKPGKKKAERYLLVFCTALYTHYLLGDRSLDTFKASVLTELGSRPDDPAVIVHDRYQNYESTELGLLVHQLCTQHLLRDLDGAAEVYPDAIWPAQIADALRGLIHQANLARDQGLDSIADDIRAGLAPPVPPRRAGRAGRHHQTTANGPASARPGCCSRSCATAPTTCCASPSPCHPPPTRPNAICGPDRWSSHPAIGRTVLDLLGLPPLGVDRLDHRAKEFDQEANMSQLMQTALRRMIGDSDRPAYARRPADAADQLRTTQPGLSRQAREEYEARWTAAVRRLPDLPWYVLDRLADAGFDLQRGLEGWRNGVADAAATRSDPIGEPGWFWKLAEDLGDRVDPDIGFEKYSHHRTGAFCRGYADALCDAFGAVEQGSELSWAAADDSTGDATSTEQAAP